MRVLREVVDDGVRRLRTEGGTGRLLTRGWSWEVREVTGDLPGWLDAAERWAAEEGALDLRSTTPAPGFQPLTEDRRTEHVRPVTLALADVHATRQFGARLAPALRAGDLLVLSGPLGAGKTSLTQGIASGLGVRGRVTSPTFVLARVHPGPLPLVHVDTYRLRDSGMPLHLDDLDLDAALEDAVTVVEWGEGLVEGLTDSWLQVRLARSGVGPRVGADEPDEATRSVRVHSRGPRWGVLAAPNVTG